MEELELVGNIFKDELKQEMKQLSQELKEAGVEFVDSWDMVNTKCPYPEAIEILIKHLPGNYHYRNKEGIIRALTVKDAKGKANSALIREYHEIPKEEDSLRWAIGNAFSAIITKDDIGQIWPIVEKKENGRSRQMFVRALGKIKSKKSEEVLINLLDDERVRY